MDNITNGLYIYHIYIIVILIVFLNICGEIFFCIIHRYIHINWMIYNWVSMCRTCQGLEICKDPLGIKHGKLGNPPKNGGFHWKKTWMCWFSWFSWFSTPRNDQSKVSNWFYMGAWPPESRVVCYAFGQDLKPELLEPVWVCLKMRCTSKMAMFMGTLISN